MDVSEVWVEELILEMQYPDFYFDIIFKLVLRLDKCIILHRAYIEK
jgi:hypothetical protein